jgi:hypothetical protein
MVTLGEFPSMLGTLLVLAWPLKALGAESMLIRLFVIGGVETN